MTERWQREVRKLGTVEPERDAWNRAATRAPGGDGLPPPRQRVVAGVVAFGVFFAAASFGWLALQPTAERTPGEVTEGTEARVTLRVGTEGSDTYPVATLKVDGVIHVGRAMSYVWDGASNPMPWLEPPYRARDFVTIELPAVVSLAGDADWADARLHPPDSFLSGEGQELGRLEMPQPIDVAPGRYVMEIRGHWRQHGNPSFYFPIEIVEAPADGAISTLAGTEWRLTAIDRVPIDEDGDRLGGASVEFKENMFGGWSGCNSFFGKYESDGSSFSVDGIGGTEVGPCSGEEAWFARLGSAESWTSDGSTLTVSGPAGSFTAARVGMEPVDVLRVECLPGSTQVLDRQVVATAQGVAGIFGPAGHAKRVEFVPVAASEGDETEVSLGDESTAATVPLAPGDWTVRCAGWSEEIRPAEITVLPEQQTSTSPEEAVPDVGVIRCRSNGSTVVETPQVAVQADGVHLRVPQSSGAGALSIFPEAWVDGVQTAEFPHGIEDEGYVLVVPAGPATVACDWAEDEDPTSRDELRASVPIEFVDPSGLYHLDELACPHESRAYPDHPGMRAYALGNDHVPLPDVIRRAVSGVRASDVVEYGGYPDAEERYRAWRVVRDGEVAAVIRNPRSIGGTWGFGPIETCEGSGIGSPGAATAGLLGSPFAVPGFERCDPYAEECRLVYVEEHAYRVLGGDEVTHAVATSDDAIVCFEDHVFPVDCQGQPGGTVWLALRMSPGVAETFTARFDCGLSPADLCTRAQVRG
jgi:heat shock protein HslJ